MSSGNGRLPLFDAIPTPRAVGTPGLPGEGTPSLPSDADARAFAVDPRHNVVLEASAGTGKTSVLVARYVNLLRAGVDPGNILAITFTRKAAAEMRGRIVAELRAAAARSELDRARWRDLRERLGDIAISTIDAFCLSLLREFPLEADLDPGFTVADETEVPRLVQEALDNTMRIALGLAADRAEIALLFAQLGTARLRDGLATLLDRRLVAPGALARFLDAAPAGLDAARLAAEAVARLIALLEQRPGGLAAFIADGPQDEGRFRHFAHVLAAMASAGPSPAEAGRYESAGAGPGQADAGLYRAVLDQARDYFLTRDGTPRTRLIQPAAMFASREAYRRHREAVSAVAPGVLALLADFQRGLNRVLARGVRQVFAIALDQYRRTLDARAVVDFTEALSRAIALLGQMDEFARSRYRLESRYHHVLVDEFQDTSRAQWELVALLVRSWGEGAGLVHEAPVPPTIFIVGDRKQSIYRFRDAEVALLEDASALIGSLRSGSSPRRAIAHSFRAVAPLLRFVNDVFEDVEKLPGRSDAFRYDDRDRFPLAAAEVDGGEDPAPVVGLCVSTDAAGGAAVVADEIARILRDELVRDRDTGLRRAAKPGDIAILFRARESHRDYERALQDRGIPSYVYKGLGFFDADEVQDLTALIGYLADPASNLRAAAFARSRFVRFSDPGLAVLGRNVAAALTGDPRALPAGLNDEDAHVLAILRGALVTWLTLVDRLPPADVIDRVIDDSAYVFELSTGRVLQSWENLKKLRGLLRRIQNRGYATMARMAGHLERLSAGDESNAAVDAVDAVNLMTAHAAKGLEFPVVFVVQMERGAGGADRPIRVTADDGHGGPSVSVGPFQSESDEDERAREREETKRLLYVSLTRARDRLYLGAATRAGELKPAQGGLAEVLPASLRALWATPADAATWQSRGGAHAIRLCRPTEAVEARAAPPVVSPGVPSRDDRPFARLQPGPDRPRRTVTELAAAEASTERPGSTAGDTDALTGTLVHRLFQASLEAGTPADLLTDRARRLLRPEETAGRDDIAEVLERGVRAYAAIRSREDVVAMFEGDCLWELTFSLAVDGEDSGQPGILRGSIDCLVLLGDGSATVVEIKTGPLRPHHERQLAWYVRAAQALFPGYRVEGRLIGAEEPSG